MNSLKNKVLFITGGLGGIGLAIIKRVYLEGVKAVAIVDINDEKEEEILQEIRDLFGGNKAIFIKADITKDEELKEAFETTVKTFNQLDVVVNNAGIANEREWKQTIAINLVAAIQGSYLAMHEYLPKFRSTPEGVIINIASVLGLEPLQTVPVYCATKAGLINFGRSISGDHHYDKYKVRVLTICPGFVKTPMTTNTSSTLFFPEIMADEISKINPVMQSADCVADTVVEAFQKGENGSLWVSEDFVPPYEVLIPPHRQLSKI